MTFTPGTRASYATDLLSEYGLSDEVSLSFEGGGAVLSVPSTHTELLIDEDALRLLTALLFPSGAAVGEIATYDRRDVQAALDQLVEHRIIQKKRAGRTHRPWQPWGQFAWRFHQATKDVPFATTVEAQVQHAVACAQQRAPERFKCDCTGGRRTCLPKPGIIHIEITDALLRRRTCRSFAERQMPLQNVADLLFYAGGYLFEHETLAYGDVLKKTAPSPGARHPTELNIAVYNVAGIVPGLYHYCVEHHALVHKANLPEDFIRHALVEQLYFVGASLYCFFSSVVPRMMWKYGTARAYRLMHLEAGHYCQNFLLVAASLGLGVFSTGAIADSLVESTFGLDGENEIIMYVAGAGYMADSVPYHRRSIRLSPHLPANAQPNLPGDWGASE